MGKHKLWRAIAKKFRRKRIRQRRAQERDEKLRIEREEREKSPRYQAWLAEQEALEAFEQEEEKRLQWERHIQWEKDEELAQQLWKERQEKLTRAREEKAKQELRIREEWEEQQRKQKAAEEEERRKQEEKQRKQEELMRQIENFIKHGGEIPASVNICTETNPDKPVCPFFSKTGACRFGDRCSRNHPRPGISRVLLIPNFYSHFGIDLSNQDEYDTDVMLEYDDSETYQHFREFYEDVLPEFELFGEVTQFKVCCNFEPHLRGNVYVAYRSEREAVAAYQKFHGRWYGGRQINVEFTQVNSWKAAICGLFFKKRCPKGRSCNFLHVFRNPGNAFANADNDRPPLRHRRRLNSRSASRSPSRRKSRQIEPRGHWRWSESPEPIANDTKEKAKQRKNHESRRSSERTHSRDKKHQHSSHRKEKKRKSSRSRRRSRSRS